MLIDNIWISPPTILFILSFFGTPQKLPTFLTYLQNFGYIENPTSTWTVWNTHVLESTRKMHGVKRSEDGNSPWKNRHIWFEDSNVWPAGEHKGRQVTYSLFSHNTWYSPILKKNNHTSAYRQNFVLNQKESQDSRGSWGLVKQLSLLCFCLSWLWCSSSHSRYLFFFLWASALKYQRMGIRKA